MKAKSLLLAALLFCGITASAQQKGDFRIGVTAGMNVSNITNSEMDAAVGFSVGARGQYFITDGLYFGFGAIISQKGSRIEEAEEANGIEATITGTSRPGYLNIPLQIGYRFDFGNDMGLFLETGPQLGIGLWGKNKVEASSDDARIDEYLDELNFEEDFFGDTDDGYAKRFELGWNVRAGFDIKQFQIGLGYEQGLTTLYKYGKNRNWAFNIGLTYHF